MEKFKEVMEILYKTKDMINKDNSKEEIIKSLSDFEMSLSCLVDEIHNLENENRRQEIRIKEINGKYELLITLMQGAISNL